MHCTTKPDYVDHVVHNTGISDVVVNPSYNGVHDSPTVQLGPVQPLAQIHR